MSGSPPSEVTTAPSAPIPVSRRLLTDVGAFAALGAMLFWFPLSDGGRARPAVAILAVLTLVAAPAAVAGTRRTTGFERALLATLGVALVVHPFLGGYRDALDTALLRYATVPLLYLVARYVAAAWRTALVAALGVSGLWLWAQAWPGWLDPPEGLFAGWRVVPWHNPSGILMGGFTVFATILAAREGGRWWHAALAVPVASGLWLSGSRGAIAMSAVGLVVVLAIHLRGRAGAIRLAAALLGAVALTFVLLRVSPAYGGQGAVVTEPDVEADAGNPLRTRRDSASNLRARVLHVEAAMRMFAGEPLLGTGLGSYGYQVLEAAEPEMNFTRSAHNEPVEVLAEGGLVVGVPFGLLYVAAAVGLAPLALRRRVSPLRSASAAAAGLLLAHTLFDIDWSFVYLPALIAVWAALARTDPEPPTTANPARAGVTWPVFALVAPLALALALAVDVTVAERSGRAALWHAEPHVAAAVDALVDGDVEAARNAARRAAAAASRDDAVASLSDVVTLAAEEDIDGLRELVLDPGRRLRTATYALGALVALDPPSAVEAADALLERAATYHAERVKPVVERVEELRARARSASAAR